MLVRQGQVCRTHLLSLQVGIQARMTKGHHRCHAILLDVILHFTFERHESIALRHRCHVILRHCRCDVIHHFTFERHESIALCQVLRTTNTYTQSLSILKLVKTLKSESLHSYHGDSNPVALP